MRPAIAYVRTSTTKQNLGLEAQMAVIMRFAEAEGYSIEVITRPVLVHPCSALMSCTSGLVLLQLKLEIGACASGEDGED
jgi:hypothetical protein